MPQQLADAPEAKRANRTQKSIREPRGGDWRHASAGAKCVACMGDDVEKEEQQNGAGNIDGRARAHAAYGKRDGANDDDQWAPATGNKCVIACCIGVISNIFFRHTVK